MRTLIICRKGWAALRAGCALDASFFRISEIRKVLASVLILVAIALPVTLLGAVPFALVVRDGAVFDAAKGVLLPHRTILILAGRIRAISSSERPMKIPAGARIIDARGKYVIPGLIDAHAHVAIVWDFAHITSEEGLRLFLANGVTSVRDVGDDIIAEKLVASYAEAHPGLCPRIFLCSPLIDASPPFIPT